MNSGTVSKYAFWGIALSALCVCSFFILHNAAWLLADDCQTIVYTGWDTPIFGFFIPPELGRFFPLDYTIYNVLCLFYDGQIPPSAHYCIHVISLLVFIGAFIWMAFNILKQEKPLMKYALSLCVVVLVLGRTIINYAQLWTGIWTIFTFLAVFLLCMLKFLDAHKWGYAAAALLAINYITYYYETVFIIPVAIGVCSLLFGHKRISKPEKAFHWSLIAGGLIFLLLYAVLVLPRVDHFYSHNTESSLIANAAKMFYSQKILWAALVFLVLRLYLFIRKKASYCIYDSLLLASLGFFLGSAFLGLNYSLYYTPAALVAIPAILAFSLEILGDKWTLALFVLLALFYGRRIPKDLESNQEERVTTYSNVQTFIREKGSEPLYFYAPGDRDMDEWETYYRLTQKEYLQTVAGWYMQDRAFASELKETFNGEHGLWHVVNMDVPSFMSCYPSAELIVDLHESKVYRVR